MNWEYKIKELLKVKFGDAASLVVLDGPEQFPKTIHVIIGKFSSVEPMIHAPYYSDNPNIPKTPGFEKRMKEEMMSEVFKLVSRLNPETLEYAKFTPE